MYVDFIEPCFGIGHNLSLICQMTSEDIKHQLIIIIWLEECLKMLLRINIAVVTAVSLKLIKAKTAGFESASSQNLELMRHLWEGTQLQSWVCLLHLLTSGCLWSK